MSAKEWNPAQELESLRCRADAPFINHYGEHVWLKQVAGGVTDCCFIDKPCERHATIRRPTCEISGCLHDEDSAYEAHIRSGLLIAEPEDEEILRG